MTVPPYPLSWPDTLPRTPSWKRAKSSFKTSLPGAIKNVSDSLRLFGSDSERAVTEVVATTNIGAVNLSSDPKDPGVAVWFMWDGELRCVAVDRYLKPEENLQAIHHILEARRTEVRHGGIVIARTAFKGFAALPAPHGKKSWREVLSLPERCTRGDIRNAHRLLAQTHHPDKGGDPKAMQEINAAKDAGMKEIEA